jgi:hypothetical protein
MNPSDVHKKSYFEFRNNVTSGLIWTKILVSICSRVTLKMWTELNWRRTGPKGDCSRIPQKEKLCWEKEIPDRLNKKYPNKSFHYKVI